MASLLAAVGGFLDAYTYLYRGRVFANGQTGNLVLMGIRLADGSWRQAGYYLFPICAFIGGVLIAEVVRSRIRDDRVIKWRHVILLLEIAVLAVVFMMPQGELDSLANISVSFVCALQTQAFRSLKGKSYISVMCTGNLRSAAEIFFMHRQSGDKKAQKDAAEYALIVGFFVAGAFAGGVSVTSFGGNALLCAIGLLLAVLIILYMRKPVVRFCERYNLRWLDE